MINESFKLQFEIKFQWMTTDRPEWQGTGLVIERMFVRACRISKVAPTGAMLKRVHLLNTHCSGFVLVGQAFGASVRCQVTPSKDWWPNDQFAKSGCMLISNSWAHVQGPLTLDCLDSCHSFMRKNAFVQHHKCNAVTPSHSRHKSTL